MLTVLVCWMLWRLLLKASRIRVLKGWSDT
jgi:hypothetical protein